MTIVSLIFLALFYGSLRRTIIAFEQWLVGSSRRLWIFVAGIFVLPAVFLTSGLWADAFGR